MSLTRHTCPCAASAYILRKAVSSTLSSCTTQQCQYAVGVRGCLSSAGMATCGRDSKHSSTTFKAQTGIGFSSSSRLGSSGSSSDATICSKGSDRPASSPSAAAPQPLKDLCLRHQILSSSSKLLIIVQTCLLIILCCLMSDSPSALRSSNSARRSLMTFRQLNRRSASETVVATAVSRAGRRRSSSTLDHHAQVNVCV